MAISDRLPGMEPGARYRNIAVGVGYTFLILMIIGAVAPADDEPDTSAPTTTATTTVTPVPTTATTAPTTSMTATSTTTQPSTATTTTTVPTSTTTTTTPTTVAPAPDAASYSYSGSGQTATDAFSLEEGLATIQLSHSGESNFIVKLVNTQTGDEQFLVNVIGGFQGTVATYTPSSEFVLDIQADSQWSANIQQPRYSSTEIASLPGERDSSDYAVLGPHEYEGATRLSYDAEIDSNVIIYLLNHEGELVDVLVNELGPAEGSTVFSANGVGLIYVETEGDWVVRVESA